MRGLHAGELLVCDEKAHRVLEKIPRRHMVAVEDENQLAVRPGLAEPRIVGGGGAAGAAGVDGRAQRGVDVAGLGVDVVLPCKIVHAEGGGRRFQLPGPPARCGRPLRIGILPLLRRAAVVEDKHVQLVLGIVQLDAGREREGHHVHRFVVGGDQHVHARPEAAVGRQRGALAPHGRHVDKQAHQMGEDPVSLGKVKQHQEDEIPDTGKGEGFGRSEHPIPQAEIGPEDDDRHAVEIA
jgi:hypothetical protein